MQRIFGMAYSSYLLGEILMAYRMQQADLFARWICFPLDSTFQIAFEAVRIGE
jgi:hypothetical protein